MYSGIKLIIIILIAITEDDDVYTVEEAVHEIGFGVFQILLSMFCGLIWVIIPTYYLCMYVYVCVCVCVCVCVYVSYI